MELVVICDEITAMGWRLAGAAVKVPPEAPLQEAWSQAREKAQVVLITQGLAQQLPAADLTAALAASRPLVLVIPDLRHAHAPQDPQALARQALGLQL